MFLTHISDSYYNGLTTKKWRINSGPSKRNLPPVGCLRSFNNINAVATITVALVSIIQMPAAQTLHTHTHTHYIHARCDALVRYLFSLLLQDVTLSSLVQIQHRLGGALLFQIQGQVLYYVCTRQVATEICSGTSIHSTRIQVAHYLSQRWDFPY